MTTTAEKIKVMQAFEDGAQIQYAYECKWVDCLETPTWSWATTSYRIKPADPEPLECWANLFIGHIDVYLSKDICKKEAGYGEPVRTIINLREVTPQDEQDRKDAARWRYIKSNITGDIALCNDDLLHEERASWDKVIDEALNR